VNHVFPAITGSFIHSRSKWLLSTGHPGRAFGIARGEYFRRSRGRSALSLRSPQRRPPVAAPPAVSFVRIHHLARLALPIAFLFALVLFNTLDWVVLFPNIPITAAQTPNELRSGIRSSRVPAASRFRWLLPALAWRDVFPSLADLNAGRHLACNLRGAVVLLLLVLSRPRIYALGSWAQVAPCSCSTTREHLC